MALYLLDVERRVRDSLFDETERHRVTIDAPTALLAVAALHARAAMVGDEIIEVHGL